MRLNARLHTRAAWSASSSPRSGRTSTVAAFIFFFSVLLAARQSFRKFNQYKLNIK
jgi:hypothetical protein